jgi:P-type Ca2+ transporter type 2C
LNRAVLWELGLLILIIYVPWLQKPFSTFSLSWQDWGIVIFLASTVSIVLEITKRLLKRYHV